MSFPIANIQTVCKERKTTIAELERNCGIGNGVIKGWEKSKGTPQLHQLVAIAEYLNVPFSRIAFGTEEKTAPVSEDGFSEKEQAFMRLFRQLPPDRQDFVIEQLRGSLLLQTVLDAHAE